MKFGESIDDRAGQLGRQAIRYLVHDSRLPAVALGHFAKPGREAELFPGQEMLGRMVTAEGLFLRTVVAPSGQGFDHVLFLTKDPGLSDAALLACRRPRARNRHEAGDGARRSLQDLRAGQASGQR